MTLQFLGQRYETTNHAIAAAESEHTGSYRGIPITFSQPQAAARAHVTLSYRGTRYSR